MIKKSILSTFFSLAFFSLRAQFIAGFESIPVDSTLGYYAGSESSSGFADNGLFFRNDFNAAFQAWTGFALSRKTDSTTAGFGNQFSCRPGIAYEGQTFGLAYAHSRIFFRKAAGTEGRILRQFRLANNTYAARSMQDGDAFAKKFGGPDGLDPDFFKLKVFNYLNGNINDSAEFFLADYRQPGLANDYILSGWLQAETGFSQPFDSIGFELSSSDNGSFGMNTPAYFCIDEVKTDGFSEVNKAKTDFIRLFPNPASDHIYFNLRKSMPFRILSTDGRVLMQETGVTGLNRLSLSSLPSGLYLFQSEELQTVRFQKW